ncbi:Transcription termination factor 2 [Tetrabaena socialis]|uniref:Transcription termination factor 2 n=1 Tax=Tetrabaena socialis TaxID=47790 RepID=A0A2J7ZHI8_9CHLO|nr:Transcription termination factor 2 [Tetrabaena socialis]|eukprot:PNG99743.1 Transcription termination factor 2 [Tetrabaena socialis]
MQRLPASRSNGPLFNRAKREVDAMKRPSWASIPPSCQASNEVQKLFYTGAAALRPPQRLDAYQIVGAVTMLGMETRKEEDGPRGGIQADDTGLGKTYMSMFMIKANPCGTTLIVSEVSALQQWKNYIDGFLNIKAVVILCGGGMSNTIIPNDVDVVLTTYSIFQRVHDIKKRRNGAAMAIPSSHTFGNKYVPISLRREWGRIILDEAHKIRNNTTVVYEAMSSLKAKVRWALTATPIQNSKADVVSLGTWLGLPKNITFDEIHKNYILRRTIQDVVSTCKHIQMLPLITKIVKLSFKYPEEQEMYDGLFDAWSKTKDSRSHSGMMELQQKALQACISPCIVSNSEFESKEKLHVEGPSDEDDDSVTFSDIQRTCDPVETVYVGTSRSEL